MKQTLNTMHRSVPAPFFFGTCSQGKLKVWGDTARFFGHELPCQHGRTDGIFAAWAWDGEILRVRNDRYGLFPLFYYAKGSEIGVSPSISTLIAEGADAELNDGSVALFLRLGQFLGNDTPFRHIYCLPPNTSFVWEGVSARISGGYEHAQVDRSVSRSEAVRTYIQLFADAMRKRLPASGRVAVPLSGGRDSRHILLELCRTGFKPHVCATVVHYPEDTLVATLLTKHLGLRHAIIEQGGNFFDAEINKNERSSFGVDKGAWPLVLSDFLLNENIDVVYDGIGGDVLSSCSFLTPERDSLFRKGNISSIVEDLLPNTEGLLTKLLTPARYRRWSRALAKQRMSEEIANHLEAHNPVTSFFFWNRTRRKIALTPFAMLPPAPLTIFAPYLDHDLFDFLASLPTQIIMDRSLHTDAILSGYPAARNIRFEDKKAPELTFRSQHAQFARRLGMEVSFWRGSDWLRTYSLAARLFTSRLNPSFAASSAWYFRPAVWLLQLESLIRSSRRIGCDT